MLLYHVIIWKIEDNYTLQNTEKALIMVKLFIFHLSLTKRALKLVIKLGDIESEMQSPILLSSKQILITYG